MDPHARDISPPPLKPLDPAAAALEATVREVGAQVEHDPSGARASLLALHARATAQAAPLAIAWATCHLAKAARLCGHYDEGLRWAREACDRFADASDHEGEVTALGHHGTLWAVLGHIPKARALFDRALSLADAHHLTLLRGPLLVNLAMTYGVENDATTYARITADAVALFRALGDRRRLAHSLANLGGGLGRMRDPAARDAYGETLTIARALQDQRIEALSLGGLGEVAALEGDLTQARALFTAAHDLFRAQGNLYDAAYQARLLAQALLDARAFSECRDLVRSLLHTVADIDARGLREDLLRIDAEACEALGDLRAALDATRARIGEIAAIQAREAAERQAQADTLQRALVEDARARDHASHADALRHANEALRKALARERAANRTLTHHALTDPLTQAANRRGLDLRADIELTRCAAAQTPLSLLLIDLDHFKRVNDTWGHPFGDEVLVGFTHRLRGVIRALDVLARVGGEEFAILLPDCALRAALTVAHRALSATRATPFTAPDGTALTLTASIGAAQLSPDEPFDALVARADASLFTAKRAGRDQVHAACAPDADTAP